jgi:hypothetical protein
VTTVRGSGRPRSTPCRAPPAESEPQARRSAWLAASTPDAPSPAVPVRAVRAVRLEPLGLEGDPPRNRRWETLPVDQPSRPHPGSGGSARSILHARAQLTAGPDAWAQPGGADTGDALHPSSGGSPANRSRPAHAPLLASPGASPRLSRVRSSPRHLAAGDDRAEPAPQTGTRALSFRHRNRHGRPKRFDSVGRH